MTRDESQTTAITPQQRQRRLLPRQRRFTVELAGEKVRRGFAARRRVYLVVALGLALAAAWTLAWRPQLLAWPAVRWWVPGLGLALLVAGPYLGDKVAGFLHSLFFLAGWTLLGAGLGCWWPGRSAELWNASWLMGLPVLGHALNHQLLLRKLEAAWQFAAVGPWLAGALLLAWQRPAPAPVMAVSGFAGLLLVYLELLTLPGAMSRRTGAQALAAAADVVPLAVRYAYRTLAGHEQQ